ncbi:apses transcription factor [Lasallia pustulata]|uniref:Apses transcription factor n=1 Tax=Lasallia pustulata TaxID=136370 RepID=A0A1W5DAL5_9LECA|nr:apses transcription factor [Lasallia pustulata]
MNPSQQYMDSHQSHMSTGQSYTPQSATAGGMSHYPQYQQQPPVLQPGPGSYAPSPGSYGHYAYSNGVTSPQSAGQPVSAPMGGQMNSQLLPLPGPMPPNGQPQHSYVGPPGGPGQVYPQQSYDASGQVAPPGMKPRVTATLWEDEGSLCFQVEAKGVCVARREDNHMINGTKLLNVAGMTRGRRDGILKSEKMRHVVKIGPMHLKGVWIPFERALDFANKEKITELLYPLFVHNIGALLYHPTNSNRTNAVMAAAERRKLENKQQQQGGMLGPAATALNRASSWGRASSIMGMNNQGSSYEWGGQSIGGSVQGTQPLSIDTGLSNARSMPTTPATTPPGNSMQTMQPYQNQQAYDNSRPMYSAPPPQQSHYPPPQNVAQQNMARFGQPMQPNPYLKNEMGPPSTRAPGSGPETEHGDHKNETYTHNQGNEQVGHGTGEEEAEHEHDTEYAHDSSTAYNANRGPYNYSSGPGLGSLHGEHPHLSPENMTGSPSQPNGSGRGTPRTTATGPPQWAPGYHTPPRAAPSSNLYSVMSDARGTATNGQNGADGYVPGPLQPTYAPTALNGATTSTKRMRSDDDQDHHSRPASRGDDIEGLKRRKTLREDSVGGPTGAAAFDAENGRSLNRTRSNIVQRRR